MVLFGMKLENLLVVGFGGEEYGAFAEYFDTQSSMKGGI